MHLVLGPRSEKHLVLGLGRQNAAPRGGSKPLWELNVEIKVTAPDRRKIQGT